MTTWKKEGGFAMERLQKVIANLGYSSRRKAEELICQGKVMVNGKVIRELGTKVSKSDEIIVDGNVLSHERNLVYFLLNKPRGVVTTVHDEHGRKTVVDMIPTNERIYPVGRLDYDTTGLLLLTNDGVLANKLMHPSSNIMKVYIAKIKGILKGYDVKRLRDGVVISGVKTSRARVKMRKVDKKKETCIVEIAIHEGRNHQVKRMFEVLGYEVMKLKRERYADLNLDGLKVGEYRPLSFKEVSTLYSLVK